MSRLAFSRYFKTTLISIVVGVLSVTAVTSYAKQAALCIGVSCKKQAANAEEFIPVFAQQIQRYQSLAPSVWPNNHVKNLTAIVVTMDRRKAWEITPDGQYKHISVAEADTYGKTTGFDTEFIMFKDKHGKNGMVLTLNEDALKNKDRFKKYAHLGTYDMFITYVHEAFHFVEQKHWVGPKNIANKERDDHYDQIEARATRDVIYQELLKAFIEPNKLEEHTKRAMATYRYYQKTYPEDAKQSVAFDNLEGTAFYIEVVSSLYVSYPELKTPQDIFRAYGVIAPTINIVENSGQITEAYNLGAVAGLILDKLSKNPNIWKKTVMAKPKETALNQLAAYFDKKITAADIIKPSKSMLAAFKKRAENKAQGVELSEESLQSLKTILLSIKAQDQAAYLKMLEDMKKANPRAYEKLLPDLQAK